MKWLNKLEGAAWLLSLILSIQGFSCKNLKYYKRKKVAAAQEQGEQEWKSRNKKKIEKKLKKSKTESKGGRLKIKLSFSLLFFSCFV